MLTAALRANSCWSWSIFSRICSASCHNNRQSSTQFTTRATVINAACKRRNFKHTKSFHTKSLRNINIRRNWKFKILKNKKSHTSADQMVLGLKRRNWRGETAFKTMKSYGTDDHEMWVNVGRQTLENSHRTFLQPRCIHPSPTHRCSNSGQFRFELFQLFACALQCMRVFSSLCPVVLVHRPMQVRSQPRSTSEVAFLPAQWSISVNSSGLQRTHAEPSARATGSAYEKCIASLLTERSKQIPLVAYSLAAGVHWLHVVIAKSTEQHTTAQSTSFTVTHKNCILVKQ